MSIARSKSSEIPLRLMLLTMMVSMIMPTKVYAQGFTDLFDTRAFSGSWEVFTKMQFVGQFLQWCISVFCFIGLAMVVMRFLITLLYLSSKNIWNNVADLKSKGKGGKFFGIGNMAKEVSNANYGAGLDTIIGFIMMLLPNIKEYSDYSESGSSRYNYEDTDTMTTYLLKSAIPMIMTVFIFSMGFNGVLWKVYANVADGMGVAAESFVNTRLDTLVDRALNTGSNPQFGYSADGTGYGKFKQNVAKSMYNKVISKTTDLNSEVKLNIGQNVDNWIGANLDYMVYYALDLGEAENADVKLAKDKLGEWMYNNGSRPDAAVISKAFGSPKITDQMAGNLEYSVVINKTDKYTNAVTVPASDLGLAADSGWHIHVFVSKKANSNETNYFEIMDNEAKKGQISGKNNSNGDNPTKQNLQ